MANFIYGVYPEDPSSPEKAKYYQPDSRIGYNPDMAMKPEIEVDPVIEAYKKDIDRTLIRKNLKLTVEERLNQMMKLREFAEELRRSGAALRRRR